MTYTTRRIHGIWALLAAAPLAGAQTPAPTAIAPITPAPAAPADAASEHTGYLFGLTFGEQLHSIGVTDQITSESIAQGVKDGLHGRKSTRAEQQQIQEFAQSMMAAALERNKAAALDFLKRNGQEKGVKTTGSGLQYKVLIPGNLKAPPVLPEDDVTVNYRGKLMDGVEFDSSYARGTPATFKANGVITGWREALSLMKPGAKWQLFIPPDLAYGDRAQQLIPAGSLLIFEVELLSVKSSNASSVAPPATPETGTPPPQSHKQVAPLKSTPNQ